MKSVTIYADSGGYNHLVLVRFRQVSLQNRHQLFWTRHLGCSHRKVFSSGVDNFAFTVTLDAFN
jgi:hypothetical protein